MNIIKTFSQTKKITFSSLYKWNKWLAILHLVQGIAILLLSTTRTFPVQTSYLTLDPLKTELTGKPVLSMATHHLLEFNLAYLVAAFFFMSAIAHGFVAFVYRKKYESDLKKGINKVRWIEYAVSASTMMVGIGFLSGIDDLSTLIMIFALDLIMNLLGLAMETYNQDRAQTNWLAYWIGCVAGVVPWLVFAIYVCGSSVYGSGQIPTFVYWIYATIFLFFSSFAVNMYLQYKKVGSWKNYLYGERVYMILSLVAKTALAWQIFAGTLRP